MILFLSIKRLLPLSAIPSVELRAGLRDVGMLVLAFQPCQDLDTGKQVPISFWDPGQLVRGLVCVNAACCFHVSGLPSLASSCMLGVPSVTCGNTVTLSPLLHSSWRRTKRSHMWLPTSTSGWQGLVCVCAVPGACQWQPSSPPMPRCWGAICVLVPWTSTTTWRT